MLERINDKALNIPPLSLETLENYLKSGQFLERHNTTTIADAFEKLRNEHKGFPKLLVSDTTLNRRTNDENGTRRDFSYTRYNVYVFPKTENPESIFGLPKLSFNMANSQELAHKCEGVIALAKTMGFNVVLVPKPTPPLSESHPDTLRIDVYLVSENPSQAPGKVVIADTAIQNSALNAISEK